MCDLPEEKKTIKERSCSNDTYCIILEKGPEFFQAIQVASTVVLQCLFLKVLEQVISESQLQPIAIKSEQTLQTIPDQQTTDHHSSTAVCTILTDNQPEHLLMLVI